MHLVIDLHQSCIKAESTQLAANIFDIITLINQSNSSHCLSLDFCGENALKEIKIQLILSAMKASERID